MSVLPAREVPVPTEIGLAPRDDHEVTESDGYLAVTAGAEVVLQRLVRLDAAHLDVVLGTGQPSTTQSTQARAMTTAAATNT